MVNAQDVSRFTDRSRITKGSSILLFSSLSLRGWNGGRRRSRLINDAGGDDENQICHLYLMRGVMNSLFARRNAENANWEMDILDAAHRSPLLSSPLLLPPSQLFHPLFFSIPDFSTVRYTKFVTRNVP